MLDWRRSFFAYEKGLRKYFGALFPYLLRIGCDIMGVR